MKRWYAAVIFLTLAVDRAVKLWAEKALVQTGTLPVIENVFHLTYVQNRGVAFGLLQNSGFWLCIPPILLIAAGVWILFFKPLKGKGCNIALSLLMGGAAGNLYDRLAYGYVIDMFDFRLINFAVFNVADSAICIGAAIFAVFYLIADKKAEKAKAGELNSAGPEGTSP